MLRAPGGAIIVGNADGDLAHLPRRPGLHRSPLAHAAGLMDGLTPQEMKEPVMRMAAE